MSMNYKLLFCTSFCALKIDYIESNLIQNRFEKSVRGKRVKTKKMSLLSQGVVMYITLHAMHRRKWIKVTIWLKKHRKHDQHVTITISFTTSIVSSSMLKANEVWEHYLDNKCVQKGARPCQHDALQIPTKFRGSRRTFDCEQTTFCAQSAHRTITRPRSDRKKVLICSQLLKLRKKASRHSSTCSERRTRSITWLYSAVLVYFVLRFSDFWEIQCFAKLFFFFGSF